MGNPDGATPDFIVEKLKEVVMRPDTHRYSQSKGIPRLRKLDYEKSMLKIKASKIFK